MYIPTCGLAEGDAFEKHVVTVGQPNQIGPEQRTILFVCRQRYSRNALPEALERFPTVANDCIGVPCRSLRIDHAAGLHQRRPISVASLCSLYRSPRVALTVNHAAAGDRNMLQV